MNGPSRPLRGSGLCGRVGCEVDAPAGPIEHCACLLLLKRWEPTPG